MMLEAIGLVAAGLAVGYFFGALMDSSADADAAAQAQATIAQLRAELAEAHGALSRTVSEAHQAALCEAWEHWTPEDILARDARRANRVAELVERGGCS